MRLLRNALSVALVLPLIAPGSIGAQQPVPVVDGHVADSATLDRLMIDRVRQDARDREAILRILGRDDVRDVARDAGVDITRAEAAVSTLAGPELHQLANQARQVEEGLSGGANVVISTTAIIIILLVVILIVVAAD